MSTREAVLPATENPTPDDPMFPWVEIDLIGLDASPGAIMDRACRAMKDGGVGPEWIEQFRTEAYAGSYDALLNRVMLWVWVNLESPDDD